MKKLLDKAIGNPLLSGSAIVFIGSLFANLLNFFFNFFMSRNLSLEDYGVLASLISVMSLFGFSAAAIVPTVVRFAGFYFAKGDLSMVRGFFFKISKTLFFTGFSVFILFILFRNTIGHFFKINDEFLIALVGLNIFIGFISVVNQALLQAKLDFIFLSIVTFIGTFSKFLFGVVFVYAGFAVSGAIWAFFVAGVLPYLLGFIRLPFLFHIEAKKTPVSFSTLFGYGGPAMLALLGLTSFISTDIILVKHFFAPQGAGIYATLSLVGRVIFFFSAPVGTVMFPLIVQKHAKEESYHNIFKLSLLLVFIASALLTLFYFLFPEFVLRLFSKSDEVIFAAPLVGFFGIFITVYSMLAICTNFYLSIKKTKVFIPILCGALLQAVLLWFYHETFFHVIAISLGITSLLLVLLLLYYLRIYDKTK